MARKRRGGGRSGGHPPLQSNPTQETSPVALGAIDTLISSAFILTGVGLEVVDPATQSLTPLVDQVIIDPALLDLISIQIQSHSHSEDELQSDEGELIAREMQCPVVSTKEMTTNDTTLLLSRWMKTRDQQTTMGMVEKFLKDQNQTTIETAQLKKMQRNIVELSTACKVLENRLLDNLDSGSAINKTAGQLFKGLGSAFGGGGRWLEESTNAINTDMTMELTQLRDMVKTLESKKKDILGHVEIMNGIMIEKEQNKKMMESENHQLLDLVQFLEVERQKENDKHRSEMNVLKLQLSDVPVKSTLDQTTESGQIAEFQRLKENEINDLKVMVQDHREAMRRKRVELTRQQEMISRQESQITSLNLQIVQLQTASNSIPILEQELKRMKTRHHALELSLEKAHRIEKVTKTHNEKLSVQISKTFDLECALSEATESLNIAKEKLKHYTRATVDVTSEVLKDGPPLLKTLSTSHNEISINCICREDDSDERCYLQENQIHSRPELKNEVEQLKAMLAEERICHKTIVTKLRSKEQELTTQLENHHIDMNTLIVKLAEAGDEILAREKNKTQYLSTAYIRALEELIASRWQNRQALLERPNESVWTSDNAHMQLMLTLIYGVGQTGINLDEYYNEVVPLLVEEIRKRDLILAHVIEKIDMSALGSDLRHPKIELRPSTDSFLEGPMRDPFSDLDRSDHIANPIRRIAANTSFESSSNLKSSRLVRLPVLLKDCKFRDVSNDITLETTERAMTGDQDNQESIVGTASPEEGKEMRNILSWWNEARVEEALPSSQLPTLTIQSASADVLKWELYAQELLLDNLRLRADVLVNDQI